MEVSEGMTFEVDWLVLDTERCVVIFVFFTLLLFLVFPDTKKFRQGQNLQRWSSWAR